MDSAARQRSCNIECLLPLPRSPDGRQADAVRQRRTVQSGAITLSGVIGKLRMRLPVAW